MTNEPTGFLYPFIEAEERDSVGPRCRPRRFGQRKIARAGRSARRTLERCSDVVAQAAAAMAERFEQGGRLFAFGNGGSATDAEGTVAPLLPPAHGSRLPAVSLVDDRAVLTALANDVGLRPRLLPPAHRPCPPGDIAVGFSTSGDSANVLRGFEEASRRELLTIGFVRLRRRGHGGQ